MQVQSIDNRSFGAKIEGPAYFRRQVKNVLRNDRLDNGGELLNFLKIIDEDKSFASFKYDSKPIDLMTDEYSFTLTKKNNKTKQTYKYTANRGPNSKFKNYVMRDSDEYFLHEFRKFIKEHYGEEVYLKACRNRPKYIKQISEERARKKLQLSVRNILKLAPENQYFYRNGVKVPVEYDEKSLPLNYIC